ncbi:MAG: response regulator transcription factor [Bacteroidetes bacterium]|nr:response regulator transcription factor [Bacteroidota bacterium]
MNILLIEDEKKISEFIRKGLKEQSYNVDAAFDGIKGQQLAVNNDYDLIILDILLPGQNGFAVCARIREEGIKTPVLMLTSMGQTDDKVKGLNTGADDYLTKPFKFEELLARIRALLRRGSQERKIIYKIDDLIMNSAEHTVHRDGKEINLTAKEFALLEYLLINKKRVMSRTQISESVWGIDFDRESNVVDTYIKLLRQKIDKGFPKPLIHTVIGVGYVLREEK